MLANEAKRSKQPSNAPEKLTERLMVYPYFRTESIPEYVAGFKRMIDEFGEKKVAEGLTRAIDSNPEAPPSPARIRQYIPREFAIRPTCPKCVDMEGWLLTTDKKGNRAVKLCTHSEARI